MSTIPNSGTGSNVFDFLLDREIVSGLATNNPKMTVCMELANVVARSRVPVLITGDAGVGKSLLARYIHRFSPRRARPCAILKCSGLREREIRTRLFGDKPERGGRPGGLLGEASGGTLVLDGVEHMTGSVQRELLQVLRDYSRTGEAGEDSGTGKRLGARLISTSRGGPLAGASGLFLEELLYGLGEVIVRIPPVRERREDIEPMAIRALRASNRVRGKQVKHFSRSAWDFFRHYDFPGNLRELYFLVDRAVGNVTGDTVYVEDLGMPSGVERGETKIYSEEALLPLEELERRHVSAALLRTGWKRLAAARMLRISPTALDRKIRLYGLERR